MHSPRRRATSFRGRDPSAPLHGLIDHAQRAAATADRLGHGPAGLCVLQHACEEFVGIAVPFADRFHFAQDINQQAALQRHAGPVHEFDVALVEQKDAPVRIEHAKPLRHVAERGIEQDLLFMELALCGAIEHGRQQRYAENGEGADRGQKRKRGRGNCCRVGAERRIGNQRDGAHGGEMM